VKSGDIFSMIVEKDDIFSVFYIFSFLSKQAINSYIVSNGVQNLFRSKKFFRRNFSILHENFLKIQAY